MKEAEVNITLTEGSIVLKELKKPCTTDLPKLIETLKQMKEFLNDYLTELIDSRLKERNAASDTSDPEEEEEEEVECDDVSGFIKGIADVNEKNGVCEKRKSTHLTPAKKQKK